MIRPLLIGILTLAAGATTAAPLETVLVSTNRAARTAGDVPTWNGTNWVVSASGGGMSKLVYDADDSDVVDDAERLGGVLASGYATTGAVAAAIAGVHDPLTLGAGDIGTLVGQVRTVTTNHVRAAVAGLYLPLSGGGTITGVEAQLVLSGGSSLLQAANGAFENLNVNATPVLVTTSDLDAGRLASGTIPNGRFPAVLPVVSGANLTSVVHPGDTDVIGPTELAPTAVTPGSYTLASITVDADGRVTSASSGAGGGGIGGSTGATDNLALRSDGTGGATLQNSPLQIDDATASTQQNVAIVNADAAANSALVITPKGTGAIILGPKPNAAASGGNSRGSYAVDLQMTRASASQVASGSSSVVIGVNNTASQGNAIAIGTGSQATGAPGGAGQGAVAIGHGNVSSSWASYTFGESNTSSAARSMAIGSGATADDLYSVVVGCWNTVSTDRQYQFKVRADNGITHQNSTGTMTFWGKLTSAPVTGVNAGDIYYNTTDNKHYGYNGSTWNAFY